MQRPAGYRGGIRLAHQNPLSRHLSDENNDDDDDDDDRLRLSNSNSDDDDYFEDEDKKIKSTIEPNKTSSVYPKVNTASDLESAIRNLRPSATHQTKTKCIFNMSHQKADLPQLNSANDNIPATSNNNRPNSDEKSQEDTQQKPWFPKADVGHVDADEFIRHNNTENQKQVDPMESTIPPAMLTAIPPVGVSTRPTAKIASTIRNPSASALFTSKLSIQRTHDLEFNNGAFTSTLYKSNGEDLQPKTTLLIHTPTSAFQPIQNPLGRQPQSKKSPLFLDIRQHKPFERGAKFKNVHVSHPQSPSIIHLMLKEDFITACRLINEMAAHPELQLDRLPVNPFKPQPNRLCACFHEGRWFRCRILKVSPDSLTATVIYLDWGMTISMATGHNYIRRLPSEFYSEPACSTMCHLNGLSDTHDFVPSEIIAQCIILLSENEYEMIVNEADYNKETQVTLFVDGKCVNQHIKQLLKPNMMMSPEEELIEQFHHELSLNVGDELKALLSSFSGKDDAFYVLLVNQDTLAIDQAMCEIQEASSHDRTSIDIPHIKTIVAARYSDDGKWYRAWVKSVSYDRQQAVVFYVDFGNEGSVDFADIYSCPDSVKSLPWLGIRVRLVNEKMTYDELVHFWKLAESNYIWIKVLEVSTDAYGVQIKLDYTVILRQERLKVSTSHHLLHAGVQTDLNADSRLTKCSSANSDMNSLVTPSLTEQVSVPSENLIRSLFEMVIKELRHLRHRINDSDEATQDRHSQLMQLLISSLNLNNSNNSKRL